VDQKGEQRGDLNSALSRLPRDPRDVEGFHKSFTKYTVHDQCCVDGVTVDVKAPKTSRGKWRQEDTRSPDCSVVT
jgi:hypothetical protein